MLNTKVVVLGAGVGGIVTANHLREKLPNDVSIILIDKSPIHTFPASYLWLMVNKRKPEQIKTATQNLLKDKVDLKIGNILNINVDSKKITTDKETVAYDYLVISVGAELDFSSFDKNNNRIAYFYDFDSAINLRDSLHNFRGGKILLVISSMPYKCPGAPYEAALLVSDFLDRNNLSNKSSVALYTPEPHPLPVAGPTLGNAVAGMLKEKNISFFPLHQLSSINSSNNTAVFNKDIVADYDLLIIVPPHKVPAAILNSKLTDETGWVPVDKNTFETKHKNVFAIGDVTTVTMPGRWHPDKPLKLPKAGVFAHSQALVVSEIISSRILNKETKASFCGDGFCMLEAGEDLAGFAYGDFFASPHPDVKLKKIGKKWHLGKIVFEKWWLSPYGLKKSFYKILLEIGAKSLKIPIKL